MRHAKPTTDETVAAARASLQELVRDAEEAERKAERIAALQRERESQQAKLRHATSIGPTGKHRLEIGNGHGHYLVDRTGAQLRAEAKASISAIDREIKRVERDGVPDPRAADRQTADLDMTRFPGLEVR
jgi:hypothetical protein